ncbi:MAG: disulfide bond formation protein DsbA [Candidatus Didemnitutus sp.]|nr:disulfide bond formation protein DsbA [Candidatus Didemnitutus sp.]
MKITYYLEVLSSWCYWAEPTWAELKARYAGRVEFEWKIANMRPEDFPTTREQCDWFYRRSEMVMRSPVMLNSGWIDSRQSGVPSAANYVAEAGKDFGVVGDELRLALAHAGEREGKPVAAFDGAIAVAVAATGLAATILRQRAESPEVAARVAASTADFFQHQLTQRPAFVLTSAIGDKAVFSGVVRLEPLVATIEAMLADVAAYAVHRAHFGDPPAA